MDAPSTCSALGAPTLLGTVPAWPSTFLLPSREPRHRWALPQCLKPDQKATSPF